MKRLDTLGITILTIVILAGCNNIKEFTDSLETTVVLTATHEGVSPETKSIRMDDGSTWWNPNEEISVFYGSGTNGGSKFISKNTTLAETTEFEGSISMSGSQAFWAVYPYSADNSCDAESIITVIPSEQTGVEGNFSDDVFPAIGKSNSLSMPFYNICGGIKFFVSRTDIKSVSFKGNNGEVLAGKVKIVFGAEGKPEVAEVIEGQTVITLSAPDGGTFKAGKYYYMTLLPGVLDGGFTMSFATASETGTLTSDKPQTVKRSVFGTLKNIDSKVSEWKSSIVEPEYVDLGLSVKWATFNVGASKPEEYGDLFAWGETKPKDRYDWSNYKWCTGGPKSLTKYNCYESDGVVDNKMVLDRDDDAAYVNWGDLWRMPSWPEVQELLDNCTRVWTEENGVPGLRFTSNKDLYTDKSIFFPAVGYNHDDSLYGVGTDGFYWSASQVIGAPMYSSLMGFDSSGVHWYDGLDRSFGFPIRPVYGEFIPVSSISLSDNSIEMSSGETILITVNVLPSNATEKSVRWVSSDVSVATVDGGKIEAVSSGTAVIYAYSSNGLSASCMVSVKANLTKPDSVEAVDLGLPSGLKWASCNVGATKPEAYGEHFAWGETEPKEDYSWSTYKWCNGDYNKLTKYCTDSSYWDSTSQMDNKAVLDPEDDAASANWGGSWRMPTDAEWTELRENCSWIWTDNYNGTGIAGRIVTSNMSGYESKSIFLPASGYRVDTDFYYAWYGGYYRSSSLYTDDPSDPWFVNFYPDNVYSFSGSRSAGFSVRPVYGEFIPVSSITIDKESLELIVGDSAQLTATISPSNATAPTVYWVSGDESTVSVDQKGNVSALAEGSTTVTAYSSNGFSASCVVTVTVIPTVDLSSSATANSYIVPKEGIYKFKTVKGNSSTPAGTVVCAQVLWETYGTSEIPIFGDLVKNVSYNDGYIYFEASNKKGNALIAAYNSEGVILWSWHIWMTDKPAEQAYWNNAGTMMDRNLGATSATPGDVEAIGLLYQWGRKDPFLARDNYLGTVAIASTISWPSSVETSGSKGTIPYTISNPTTFVICSNYNYDWFYNDGTSSVDETRWGSNKTIFDPCPPGWRVPDGGNSGVWSKATGVTSGSFVYTWDPSHLGMNFSGKFGSVSTIWYPAVGYLNMFSGSCSDYGRAGEYWSCTTANSADKREVGILKFTQDGDVFPFTQAGRANGLSVRCQKEE